MKKLTLIVLFIVSLCPSAHAYYISSGSGEAWSFNEFKYVGIWKPSGEDYWEHIVANDAGFTYDSFKVIAEDGDALDATITFNVNWYVENHLNVGFVNAFRIDYTYIPIYPPEFTETFTVQLGESVFSGYSPALSADGYFNVYFNNRPTPIDPNEDMWAELYAEWNLFKNTKIVSVTSNPIPEPATILLIGTGLIGIAGSRKFSKKS